jgi:hypothetical protein
MTRSNADTPPGTEQVTPVAKPLSTQPGCPSTEGEA